MKLFVDQLPETEDELKRTTNMHYSNVAGSIMYVMVCSTLDIAYVVSVLSIFMSNPGELNWEAMKILIKYLKGTST